MAHCSFLSAGSNSVSSYTPNVVDISHVMPDLSWDSVMLRSLVTPNSYSDDAFLDCESDDDSNSILMYVEDSPSSSFDECFLESPRQRRGERLETLLEVLESMSHRHQKMESISTQNDYTAAKEQIRQMVAEFDVMSPPSVANRNRSALSLISRSPDSDTRYYGDSFLPESTFSENDFQTVPWNSLETSHTSSDAADSTLDQGFTTSDASVSSGWLSQSMDRFHLGDRPPVEGQESAPALKKCRQGTDLLLNSMDSTSSEINFETPTSKRTDTQTPKNESDRRRHIVKRCRKLRGLCLGKIGKIAKCVKAMDTTLPSNENSSREYSKESAARLFPKEEVFTAEDDSSFRPNTRVQNIADDSSSKRREVVQDSIHYEPTINGHFHYIPMDKNTGHLKTKQECVVPPPLPPRNSTSSRSELPCNEKVRALVNHRETVSLPLAVARPKKKMFSRRLRTLTSCMRQSKSSHLSTLAVL